MIVVFALAFLALHLPYLPASLEDLDSINFALGIRRFDVARHQPHPPGYPVFILIGKALHAAGLPEVTALALIGVGAGTLGVLALWVLFCRLGEGDTPRRWLVAAAAVAMTTPLYWLTAVRPLSDTSGLAAALAVQAMTLGAADPRSLAIAAFCAGLAAGLRSQVIWLTVPLVALRAFKGRGTAALIASAFAAGALLWFVPLVVISGGPTAYWHALSDQGAEDLGSIQMLWTRHGVRDVSDALYYAFVAPWAAWPVAVVALTAAWAGLGRLATRQRRTLVLLMVAFLPYLAFDLLFQESFTSRYALPLVVPTAYLIVAGLRLVPWDLGLPVAAALAMYCAHIGGTSIAAYSRAEAPAFRLLDDMRAASANAATEPPVLAADRRESFDLRGPRKWLGEATPRIAAMLEAPPQHEWLEAVKYWNGGGRAPLWFVVDPARAAIDLVQHGDPLRYRWALGYPVLLSGVRPNEMDWYRVDQPEWYVGEGWALTREPAGVADADGRDPAHGPITGWVRGAAVSGGTLMIGGRSFDPAQRPRFTVTIGPHLVIDETLMPGAFLRFASLPSVRRDAAAPAYDAVTVTTTAAAKVAVEQFDVSATRPLIGFGVGWHEQEFNPRTGRRWRWLSQRGELNVVAEPVAVGPNAIRPHRGGHLTLHLEGESPRTYFPRGSRLVVRSGGRVVFDEVLSSDFSRDVPLDGVGETMVLETDQTYAPAERSRRTLDRRRLGLRMFSVRITRVS